MGHCQDADCLGQPVPHLMQGKHAQHHMPAAEDYAKALEKDKSASKVRRKSHMQLLEGGSRPGTPSSMYSPDTGLIPASFTAPTASYQPYVNGAHLGSRPGTPGESSLARQAGDATL